jgi:hypothetical protein
MPTLGDVARQAAARADATPDPSETPPPKRSGPTLGDVARQAAAPPPDDQPPALLRRPPEEEAAPAPPPRRTGETAGEIVGRRAFVGPYRDRYRYADDESQGEPQPGPYRSGYVLPDPNAVREPTWGETIGLGAARVLPPIIAAGVTTPFLSPVGGAVSGALAATAGDIAAQRYEKAHGLRREVRPYQSIVSGAAGGIPGLEMAPEAGLLTRAGVRAAEGAGINVGATTAETGLEEHRLPTLGDVARSAATGAAFGAAAGTAEHGVHAYVRGRAERAVTTPDDTGGGGGGGGGSAPPPGATEGGPAPVGSLVEYDAPDGGRTTARVVAHHDRMDGPVAIVNDGRIVGPEHNPNVVALPEARPRMQDVTVNDLNQWQMIPDTPADFLDRMRAGTDVRPPLRAEAAPETTLPPVGEPGPRMVTRPGETIGGGGEPSRVQLPWEEVEYLRSHGLTDDEIRMRQMGNPDIAQRPAGEFVGPPAPEAPAPEGFVGPPRPVTPQPIGAGPSGAPPETPPGPLASGMPEEGPEPRYPPPLFQRAGGLHRAFTGEDIPAAREPGPERLQRQVESVDRLFSDHPPETRQVLKDMLVANADDIAERGRQTQPVERTRALADELVLDPEQLWKRGKGAPILTAEQKLSVLNLIKSQMGQVADLQAARDALPADAPQAAHDEAALRLKIKNQELALTVAAAEGDISETGRAMNILKYQVRQLDTGDPKFIRAALREGVPADKIATIIHQIPEDDYIGRYRNLLALRRPQTWTQSGLSYMTTNILSSPQTPIRKALADAWAVVHDPLIVPFAGGWERIAPERFGGKAPGERTVYAGELGDRAAAGWAAKGAAWKRMMSVIKEGFTPEQAQSYAATRRELFEGRGKLVRGLANYPGRALAAAEAFTKTFVEHMELAGSAYTAARNEGVRQGLTGDALDKFIPARAAQLVKDPQFHADALTYAERRVYREKGTLDTALIRFGNDIPAFRYIMPLVRIPVALFRQGWQHAPMGFFTKLGRAEGRLGAQARGEAALGTLIGAYLMHKALNDELDGSGPSNPSDFRAWWDAGHRPNSIKIGPYRIGHHVLPWSLEASIIGNMRDTYKDLIDKGDDAGALQLISMFGRRQAKSLLQQSTIRNIAEFTQGIGDTDENTFNRFAGSLMTGFIPYSGLLRDVKRVTDPTLRKATTPGEYVEAGMPGLSTRLQPKIGAKGEELRIDQPGGALGRAFLPMDVSTDQPDPVRDELKRIGLRHLTIPSASKVGPKKLTPEERTAIMQAKGQATVDALNRLFDNPAYQRIPDTEAGRSQQARAAHGVITQMRTRIARSAAGLAARGEPITLDALMPSR